MQMAERAHPRGKLGLFSKKKKKSDRDKPMKEENASESEGHFCKYPAVVAIDFGTTYSGYAYSFTSTRQVMVNKRQQIRLNGGQAMGLGGPALAVKQPTVLLLKDGFHFHSFGYEAQQYYHDVDPCEIEDWLYFEKFKMELHTRKHLHEEMQLIAANGKRLPAVLVFVHALRYFKYTSLQELNQQTVSPLSVSDVRWVITVPAIWRESAKQFMRKAAFDAGLIESNDSDQLAIALEPEAASIYCRSLQLSDPVSPSTVNAPSTSMDHSTVAALHHQGVIGGHTLSLSSTSSTNSSTVMAMTPDSLETCSSSSSTGTRTHIKQAATKLDNGVKYIVADCGGGTVDLTLHQLQEGGKLKELYKASGGAWGSIGVDYQFELLLVAIFGLSFIEHFIKYYPVCWLELMRSFEIKKHCFDPFRECSTTITLPFSFVETYRRTCKRTIEQAIFNYGDPLIQWSPSNGHLRLLPKAMSSLFQPAIDNIVKHIHKVMSYPSAQDVKYLFMVGGFSQSPLLQESVLNEFAGLCEVVIPRDVSLCTIKGAVMFGLDTTIVQVRHAALTYGVGCLNSFNPKIHPPHKKVTKGGKEWVTDIFDTFVTVNQPISLGRKITRYYNPASNGLDSTVITVFASEKEYNTFVTDPGVIKVAELKVQMPSVEIITNSRKLGLGSKLAHSSASNEVIQRELSNRELKVTMDFSSTEINVTALDCTSGRTASVNIDFLFKK